ncbi:hypothetical protein ACFPRL_03385 [Pseudoclavibacter helvolus]
MVHSSMISSVRSSRARSMARTAHSHVSRGVSSASSFMPSSNAPSLPSAMDEAETALETGHTIHPVSVGDCSARRTIAANSEYGTGRSATREDARCELRAPRARSSSSAVALRVAASERPSETDSNRSVMAVACGRPSSSSAKGMCHLFPARCHSRGRLARAPQSRRRRAATIFSRSPHTR